MGVIPTLVKLLGIHCQNAALTEMCLVAFGNLAELGKSTILFSNLHPVFVKLNLKTNKSLVLMLVPCLLVHSKFKASNFCLLPLKSIVISFFFFLQKLKFIWVLSTILCFMLTFFNATKPILNHLNSIS